MGEPFDFKKWATSMAFFFSPSAFPSALSVWIYRYMNCYKGMQKREYCQTNSLSINRGFCLLTGAANDSISSANHEEFVGK